MDAALYHRAIVAAARARHGAGRLEHPDGSATVDNPLCGDRVTVDVGLEGERINAIGQVVRGCVLCEACASILARDGLASECQDIDSLARALHAMLASGVEPPAGRWRAFSIFLPVSAYRSRHQCVLLPVTAMVAALRTARSPG